MPAGQPPKYKSVDQLASKVNEYFADCESKKNTPTTYGLALYLGFCDRQSLYDYKSRPEYSCLIKSAIDRIGSFHEARLSQAQCVGSIFWLKNHNWKDNQDHTLANPDGTPLSLQVTYVNKPAGS
jgi:hypothetical protein